VKLNGRDSLKQSYVQPDSRPPHPIVRLEGVSKHYEEAGQPLVVLNNVNATFQAGQFIVLLGKSGSGKTTLLNLISGIDNPTSGDIRVNGTSITRLSDRERTLFRRDHIGFVFQFFNLIPTLNVLENVLLPMELGGQDSAAARERAMVLLERVGLAGRPGTFPDRLSGGEQQRVAIARALGHDPLLILADEPTGNLDTDTGNEVLALLLELSRQAGKTLIMATHNPEVIPLADRVFHIREGQLMGIPDLGREAEKRRSGGAEEQGSSNVNLQ
jgi:putative ABC transport system ATP-binding protein